MFKVNDLVIITKQSPGINSHIDMRGLQGFIEEIQGDVAQFQELNEKGYGGGGGGVPLDCLTLANDNPQLIAWKQAREERIAKNRKEAEERTKRFNQLKESYLQKAIELGVNRGTAEEIFKLSAEFESDWERNCGW